MPVNSSGVVMGILVGGQAKRLGGVQKALLRPPQASETDASLLARLLRMGRAAGLEVVLLGQATLGAAAEGVLQLPDAEPRVGPLGGLASLLAHAGLRPAVAIACDMPYVTPALLDRLLSEAPGATVLAARDPHGDKWQAMFVRYASREVRPIVSAALAAGQHSFQQLFARLPVTELRLAPSEHEALRDWDTPEDMQP